MTLRWLPATQGFRVEDADAKEERKEAELAEALDWIVEFACGHLDAQGKPPARGKAEDAYHEAGAAGTATGHPSAVLTTPCG